MTTPAVVRIARLEARTTPFAWRWPDDSRVAIEAHWHSQVAAKPRLFNGRVLLVHRFAIVGDACVVDYFAADFKDFLAWRDLGTPDRTIRNGYAMGVLQGSDGAFVCGVMGPHTANEGRVYFPSGTPDLSDLRPDGSVDLATSVTRELAEETSLPDELFDVSPEWYAVATGTALAFMRPVRCHEPASAVAARIRAAIAVQADPELSDAVVIGGPEDIDPARMPLAVRTYLHWYYGAAADEAGAATR